MHANFSYGKELSYQTMVLLEPITLETYSKGNYLLKGKAETVERQSYICWT